MYSDANRELYCVWIIYVLYVSELNITNILLYKVNPFGILHVQPSREVLQTSLDLRREGVGS